MRRFTAGNTQGMIDYGDYQVYYDRGEKEKDCRQVRKAECKEECKQECKQECKEECKEEHPCFCKRVKCKKPSLISRCYCWNHNVFYQVGGTTL